MAAGDHRLDVSEVVALIADVDVDRWPDDRLGDLVIDLERLLNAAHALSAVAIDALQRRGDWAAEGCLSAAGWAAQRTGSSRRALRARCSAGAGLRLLPSAATAARDGRISPDHMSALARCARHPVLVARDENRMVEQARTLDADAFKLAARQWEACAVAVEGPDPATLAAPESVDQVHLSQTFDGRYRLDGSFSAETGQLLYAALDAEVDRALRARRNGDVSVPPKASQLRATALVDLVGQTMRREPSDQSIPDRYRVAVVVHHDELVELPLVACDSPAFRVVVNARSEILDVGRLTQVWPSSIRRAITHRDRGCVFPGCDRPPSWCDIHHCQSWKSGGSTSVNNGMLLCRRHHTFIHKQRWRISVENGKPIIHMSDGRRHLVARWPLPFAS